MESSRPIIWSPEADGDLENILIYLEENWSDSVITDFLGNLFKVLDWISSDSSVL